MLNRNMLAKILKPLALAFGFSALAGAAFAQGCPAWENAGRANIQSSAGALQNQQSYSVVAGGDVNASGCNYQLVEGGAVRGYFVSSPDFELNYQGDNSSALAISVNSGCDTVLLVNDAMGNWHFNDDGNGNLDARISIDSAASGTYDIWVGTYGNANCQANMVLQAEQSASQVCPAWENPGMANLQGSTSSFQSPQVFNVVAGGDVDVGNRCNITALDGRRATGYFISSPDFELNYQGDGVSALELSVNAPCDTVLMVNDSNGNWHFDDDSNGNLDPRIVIDGAGSGTYDIWVGTYGNANCGNSQLVLQSAQPASQVCPAWENPGMANLQGSSSSFQNPQVFDVVAGGDVNVGNRCNIQAQNNRTATGYFITSPDFELNYQGDNSSALELSVNSSCDTVLLVNDSFGNWHFDDDGNGNLDARIEIANAGSGTYDIWVGTYGSQTCGAQLVLHSAGGGK